LEENFTKRWNMMLTDLHYVGALLNPYLKDVLEIQENGDAKRALNRVVRKLCAIFEVGFNDAMAELTEYEERQGPYSPMEAPDIREAHMEPHQWWHRVGCNALPKIAKHILSLTCSASSCERNWSMYSFVHSKSRTASRLIKPRHWYTSIPIRSSSAKDQGQNQCVGTITTSSPRIQTSTTMGTKQRAREMMTAAMMMMVSLGHSRAKFQEQMNQGLDMPRTTMLMAKILRRLTRMVSQMTAQLEVRMLEIVPQRLVVMEEFATSNPQRTMMIFPMVMTEVTAMYAMEMMMTATTMCRTKMVKKLPTMLLLVVMSRLLLKGYRMMSSTARGSARRVGAINQYSRRTE
jgi:hypothetical protein